MRYLLKVCFEIVEIIVHWFGDDKLENAKIHTSVNMTEPFNSTKLIIIIIIIFYWKRWYSKKKEKLKLKNYSSVQKNE